MAKQPSAEQNRLQTGLVPSDNPRPAPPAHGGKKKKLSKKEKKALKKQQAAFEKQLVAEGKIAPRYRYVPRNSFARILSVCLAFFLGFFVALGGLFGGLAIAGTKTSVKNIFNFAGLDYKQYITDEAAELSVLDLVSELGKTEFSNLNSIGQYTPYLESMLNSVADIISDMGIFIDVSELMDVNFTDLGTYFSETVLMNATLADVLKIENDDSADAIMRAICYKSDGEKTTINELTTGATDLLMNIALADVLSIADDDSADAIMRAICYKSDGEKTTINDLTTGATDLVMALSIESLLGTDASSEAMLRYLAYGSQGENYEIVNGQIVMLEDPETGKPYEKRTIGDLTSEDADLLGGVKICDFVTVDDSSSSILKAIADWTIADLTDQSKIESLRISDVLDLGENPEGLMGAMANWTLTDLTQQSRIERLRISQIIDLGENPSGLMGAIADWRIGDMTNQSKIDSISLGDIIAIDDDSPAILRSLKDVRIGEFSSAFDTLCLGDILGDDIDSNKILKNLKNSTLNSLNTDVQNLTVAQVFGADLYSYIDIAASYSSYMARYNNLSASEKANSYEIKNGTFLELLKAYEYNKTIESMSNSPISPVVLGENQSVETYYVYGNTEVTYGYLLSENGVYTVLPAENVKISGTELYTETKTYVSPVYTWYVFNYATGNLDALSGTVTQSGGGFVYDNGSEQFPVSEDGSGYYYTNGTDRVDLERKATSYTLNGTACTTNDLGDLIYGGVTYRVYAEGDDFYILLRGENVTAGYYYTTGNTVTVVSAGNVTEHWRLVNADGTKGAELDRFLDGIWHLLFCEKNKDETTGDITLTENTEVKVFDIIDSISDCVSKMNDIPLYEMYFFAFITTNPYVDIQKFGYKNYKNLNELSMSGIVGLIQHISGLIP